MLCAKYGEDDTEAVSAIEADGYYANGYLELSPETSYTMVVNIENVYGSTACFTATYVTAAIPIGTTVSLAATSSRKAASCFRLEGIKPADIARPEVSLKAASKAFSKRSLKSSAEKAF